MVDDDQIDEIRQELAKQGSFRSKLWSGIIFGIGSTLGVAVILYVAVIVVRQFEHLPLIGQYFGTVTPTLEKTLEEKVPNLPERATEEPESSSTSSETSVSSSTSRASSVGTSYFALTLPAGWDVTLEEGSKGLQRSRLQAESDDFVRRVDETTDGPFTPIYYDAGESLDVHVTTTGDTDHGGIQSTKTVELDGVTATYHVFTEPSTMSGQQLDVHATKENLAYTLTFTYNPDKDPNGPQIFDDILASFTFKE